MIWHCIVSAYLLFTACCFIKTRTDVTILSFGPIGKAKAKYTGCPKKTEDFDFLLERPFLAQIYHPIPFYDGKLRDFLIFMCSSTWFSLKYWRKWDLKSEVFFHNFPHFAQMITVAFWLSSKDGTITLVVVPQISKTFFLRIAESLSFPKIPIVTSLGHYE